MSSWTRPPKYLKSSVHIRDLGGEEGLVIHAVPKRPYQIWTCTVEEIKQVLKKTNKKKDCSRARKQCETTVGTGCQRFFFLLLGKITPIWACFESWSAAAEIVFTCSFVSKIKSLEKRARRRWRSRKVRRSVGEPALPSVSYGGVRDLYWESL